MGQLTFNMIKLEDDRIIEWNDDLSDENSAMYMDVANGVAKEVNWLMIDLRPVKTREW